ncbi:hypothetical protein I3843_03G141500 [Carya illinoinensis]|nr:hypothetical protein I3843_03G141500 [Carya illinoinensis]
MQSIRDSILKHMRVGLSVKCWLLADNWNMLKQFSRKMCSSTTTSPDQIMDRLRNLIKSMLLRKPTHAQAAR